MKASSRKPAPAAARAVKTAASGKGTLALVAARGRKGAAAASPGKAKAPPKIGDADNWDWRLGFLMHDVSRLRRSVFDEFVKPMGVSRSQWWVLAHLARNDGMIQSDLANMLELGKAALGGLVDRLEASGLIRRQVDAVDRRAKRIFVSPEGNLLIKEMQVQSHEMSERVLVGLDQPARHALADMLTLVKRNLVQIKKEVGSRVEDDVEPA